MFVFNGVPSLMEMWRKYIYGFKQRLTNSDNAIVAATASACRLSSSSSSSIRHSFTSEDLVSAPNLELGCAVILHICASDYIQTVLVV